MAERYTAIENTVRGEFWVAEDGKPIANCGTWAFNNNWEKALLIARALNAYAALESVKSIGEANGGKDE